MLRQSILRSSTPIQTSTISRHMNL
ncbi:MAG: hypothetical protein GXY08_08975 [Ruminococcus sp.]|nr:hypothetical protein [Ruminococcus sp.]